jgi:hypothetical protein
MWSLTPIAFRARKVVNTSLFEDFNGSAVLNEREAGHNINDNRRLIILNVSIACLCSIDEIFGERSTSRIVHF